jgi:hypothetical protein
MPASAPTDRAVPLLVLVGLTLLEAVEDIVGTIVEDEDVVDDKEEDDVKDGPTIAAMVIAPA